MAKDIVVKVGEYTGADGKPKGEFKKIGVILENTYGEYIMLDPTVSLSGVLAHQAILDPSKAGKMVMASIFDKSENLGAGAGNHQVPTSSPQTAPQGLDDIPF